MQPEIKEQHWLEAGDRIEQADLVVWKAGELLLDGKQKVLFLGGKRLVWPLLAHDEHFQKCGSHTLLEGRLIEGSGGCQPIMPFDIF